MRFRVRSRRAESRLDNRSKTICKVLLPAITAAVFSTGSYCQLSATGPAVSLPEAPTTVAAMPSFNVSSFRGGAFDEDAASSGGAAVQPHSEQHGGLVSRSVRRILKDQKGLYPAPFQPSNFKWDAIALAGTAGFLVADHHIENRLPGGHYQLWQNTSNIAIGGLAATLGGVWLYGIKTEHQHARETGELELETLVNTFLIYAPMQFIAGRQRPGEGNGHGDFLRHSAINTSFPGGHAMFTWAMATVVAHEYSQPWVRVLTYSAAFTVTLSRFMARDHWSSDMWVGTALGLGIGTYTFHAHCDPELSSSCKRHYARVFKSKSLAKSPLGSWPNAQPTEAYRNQ